jgi:hypothetical protein
MIDNDIPSQVNKLDHLTIYINKSNHRKTKMKSVMCEKISWEK